MRSSMFMKTVHEYYKELFKTMLLHLPKENEGPPSQEQACKLCKLQS